MILFPWRVISFSDDWWFYNLYICRLIPYDSEAASSVLFEQWINNSLCTSCHHSFRSYQHMILASFSLQGHRERVTKPLSGRWPPGHPLSFSHHSNPRRRSCAEYQSHVRLTTSMEHLHPSHQLSHRQVWRGEVETGSLAVPWSRHDELLRRCHQGNPLFDLFSSVSFFLLSVGLLVPVVCLFAVVIDVDYLRFAELSIFWSSFLLCSLVVYHQTGCG